MFLKQSGEKQRQQEQEKERQERRRVQEQEAAAAAAAPVGAGWLKGSSSLLGGISPLPGGTSPLPSGTSPLPGGTSLLGGTSSWLKAWQVDDDSVPPAGAGAAGRRTSRGRHTLSHQPAAAAGLNTDSVSSYAPSELGAGTLSDMTPP